jgi:hypothetical protein
MTLLRIILLIVLGWYAVRFLLGWISRGDSGQREKWKGDGKDSYRDLTDQSIEDADYEDL